MPMQNCKLQFAKRSSVSPIPNQYSKPRLIRCQAKFLTSRHVRMHKVVFHISNTLRKLMIRAQGLVLWKVCRVSLGLEKEK